MAPPLPKEVIPTKKQHVKPDTVLKSFWQNNERFADLFNAALFSGQTILHPASLTECDTDLSTIVQNKHHLQSVQRTFDVVKKSANGVEYILFALENQQNIHYAMPLRHMLNEALAYYKQYTEITLRNDLDGNYNSRAEFLSKFKKTDKLHPVISLCLYYGDDEWDGPLSLVDMLNIPDDLKPLVADYKMHLVQIHKNGHLNFHNKDVQTVFEVCRTLYDQKNRTTTLSTAQQIDPALGVVIGTIVGSQRFINYALQTQETGGTMYMWNSIRIWEEDCEKRGERVGLFKGIISAYKECNLPQADAIERLKTKHGLSQEEADTYMQQYW